MGVFSPIQEFTDSLEWKTIQLQFPYKISLATDFFQARIIKTGSSYMSNLASCSDCLSIDVVVCSNPQYNIIVYI